ncbi:hypothetical protein SDC9_172295 [bioreactor metagenome]|uniref:Uncharacterized protein n=1 Tax=bioreactor metagenome TaxID=1076179 RepID=A0A645GFK3_9ZZZZ
MHIGIVFAGSGQAQSRTRHALVVAQLLALDIAQGRMGEDQLLGRERRLQALRGFDARAKESQLKAPGLAAGLQLPCDVPPLRLQIRVAAEVARELQGLERQSHAWQRQAQGSPAQTGSCQRLQGLPA